MVVERVDSSLHLSRIEAGWYSKSPSTAFNYDVIANTDDGYFLRYTLYINGIASLAVKSRV